MIHGLNMKTLKIESVGKVSFGNSEIGKLGPNDVLIKLSYVGLCGSDINTYSGVNPLVSYPRIPGHEAAGTISAIGSEVSDKELVGKRVILWPYTNCGNCSSCLQGRTNACRYNHTLGVQRDGALSEFIILPEDSVILNASLTSKQQVLVEPLSVGFHASNRAEVKPSDTVLVLGCGMIGLGAIMSAAAKGHKVIAVDTTEDKKDIALKLGASLFLTDTGDNLVKKVNELTQDVGVNVVIEAVGSPETFTKSIDIAAYCARVIYVGYSKKPVTYDTKYFNLKELDIRGSRNATKKDFNDVVSYLEQHPELSDLLVSREFTFAEADKAFPYWQKNRSNVLKIVVKL